MNTQESTFLQGEADQWFLRNKEVMHARDSVQTDPPLVALEACGIQPRKALEIGAANGYRMHVLHQWLGSEVSAIEPSAEAVADGRARYPEVSFEIGTASALPYADSAFDCVFICGVFCWVDRAHLLKAASEADRVLEDGGYLVIADFLPRHPQRVLYHHKPEAGIYTFKMDYSQLFLAANTYSLLSSNVLDHSSFKMQGTVKAHDRFGITLLRKGLLEGFPRKDRPEAE